MHKEYLIDWRYYTCGANGQIYSYYYKRYLDGHIRTKGYVLAKLKCIDGKFRAFYWHRVIWTFFYGTIPDGYEINHISEVKTDNSLCNLNLMTPKENSNWASRNERISESNTNNPLKSKAVVAIDSEGNVVYEYQSIKEVSCNGFDRSNVSACCRGKRKTHGGYRWYYKEDYLNEKESE